jgi:hypothetical protein
MEDSYHTGRHNVGMTQPSAGAGTDAPTDAPTEPPTGAPTGRRRLAVWAAGRVVVVALPLGTAVALWHSGAMKTAEFSTLTAKASAQVIRSTQIAMSGGTLGQTTYQLQATVRFTPPRSTHSVRATIEPANLTRVADGQRLPIRFDPGDPARAAYDGPGGDANLQGGGPFYVEAGIALLVAAVVLAAGINRLARMTGAVRRGTPTTVTASQTIIRVKRSSGGGSSQTCFIRVQGQPGAPDLEWQVLTSQPGVTGIVDLYGPLKAGRWLVVRLPSGTAVWPRTRAQPVIGASSQAAGEELDVLRAHRRLLAAYVRVLRQADSLPAFTSRPPGAKPAASWWTIGAPRLLVRWLTSAHIRRRMGLLGRALTQAAVLTEAPDDTTRRALHEASAECAALAGTVPRRAWIAALISGLSVALAIYTPFFPVPHAHVHGGLYLLPVAVVVLFIVLVFGAVPLYMFFHSVRCKRALCSSDVYQYEREAFAGAGAPAPMEWEARRSLRWLTGLAYGLVIGGSLAAGLGPGGRVFLGVLLALFALLLLVTRLRRRAARAASRQAIS